MKFVENLKKIIIPSFLLFRSINIDIWGCRTAEQVAPMERVFLVDKIFLFRMTEKMTVVTKK